MPTVPPHSHREFRGVVEHTHPTSRSGVWRYSSNQTIADPGSGNLRWSADRLTLAMSKTTRDGVDAAHALAQVAVGDSIRVQVKTDATNAGWWEVTSVTDRGAWVEFGVTPTGGSPTAPANNTELMVTITYESSSVGVGNGGALTEADGDARYVNVTGDTMTGALTVDEGVQSNLYVRSASQRLWAMSRDSDLQSFLVSSDALNTAKRPLTIQASKVLLASGAESATDTNAVVPKSYVDGKVDKTGDTMTGALAVTNGRLQAQGVLIMAGDPSGAQYDGTLWIQGTDVPAQIRNSSSGQLTPVRIGTPTASDHAATKAYVDAQGVWQPWTPTVGGALTLGNGTVKARYTRIGNTVHGSVVVTLGSTSVMGSGTVVTFTPPEPLAANTLYRGVSYFSSVGVNAWTGIASVTGTAINVSPVNWATGANALFSATAPFTWKAGDSIAVSFTYEAA